MADPQTPELPDDEQQRAFMKALLEDVQALEYMIEHEMLETGIRRIGAEQEMFLVDRNGRPAPLAIEILDHLKHERFTTELARFNLEANLAPLDFGGDCLRRMEADVDDLLAQARAASRAFGARIALVGILPSIRQTDLTLDNMTPKPRYHALNREMLKLRSGELKVYIKGLDELELAHDNIMLESCNTSFQVHFQVAPREFARFYNLAQVVSAPVLAAAVNSPLLLGRRLWMESRVALFQQSVDVRSAHQQQRGYPQRVSFGQRWVKESVLEIFREDIARFRVVLATGLDERPLVRVRKGEIPPLSALRLFNGTVYRWNRACYGTRDGVAHLRIENRALPSGPTPIDEVANAAFYFGLMAAMVDDIRDVGDVMRFEIAKSNFIQAAEYGLNAQFTWLDDQHLSARELILRELLDTARRGLVEHGVDPGDVDRYLTVIGDRVESGQTGADWALAGFDRLGEGRRIDQGLRALVNATVARQEHGDPVHAWSPVTREELGDWRESFLSVGQIMTTHVFTVRPHDLVNLAASLMEWEHIKHVPVEDDDGNLVGLVSSRALLRLISRGLTEHQNEMVPVKSIMKTELVTVAPGTSTLEALEKMRRHRVGCLPVVEGSRLVGIITEHDFLDVAGRLLDEKLRGGPGPD